MTLLVPIALHFVPTFILICVAGEDVVKFICNQAEVVGVICGPKEFPKVRLPI
jgi:hypothetical protein